MLSNSASHLTLLADHAQQARPPSPHSAAAAALRRASASPPPSPRQSLSLAGASYTGSSNRRVSPLRDQQPSTPGVSLWNTSWQRSLRAESPSSDNASPSVSGTAWIPFQPSQTVTRDEQDSSNSSKPEANLPKATGSSHRSRRVPREILTAETNAVLEAEFRMMAHARHFVTAEADALHKEVCFCLRCICVVSISWFSVCDFCGASFMCRFCSCTRFKPCWATLVRCRWFMFNCCISTYTPLRFQASFKAFSA